MRLLSASTRNRLADRLAPSYVWYPETAGRSLEEIDIIFAVAYTEKRSYVTVAAEMPSLSPAQIESEAQRLGIMEQIEAAGHSGGVH